MTDCPTPSKLRFGTQGAALAALTRIRRQKADAQRRRDHRHPDTSPLPSRVYRCRCGWWHLTSKEPR